MKEAIEQMLATEEEAKRIVAEASQEAESLLAASRAKAVETQEKTRHTVQEESARLVSEAERDAKAIHDRKLADARAEAKAMQASPEKTEAAVQRVMRELLGGQ